jgi:hypothetical protein
MRVNKIEQVRSKIFTLNEMSTNKSTVNRIGVATDAIRGQTSNKADNTTSQIIKQKDSNFFFFLKKGNLTQETTALKEPE